MQTYFNLVKMTSEPGPQTDSLNNRELVGNLPVDVLKKWLHISLLAINVHIDKEARKKNEILY